MEIDLRDIRYIGDSNVGIDTFVDMEGKLSIHLDYNHIKAQMQNDLFGYMSPSEGDIVVATYDKKLKTIDAEEFKQEIARDVVKMLGNELENIKGDSNLQHAWDDVMVAVNAYMVTRKMVSD